MPMLISLSLSLSLTPPSLSFSWLVVVRKRRKFYWPRPRANVWACTSRAVWMDNAVIRRIPQMRVSLCLKLIRLEQRDVMEGLRWVSGEVQTLVGGKIELNLSEPKVSWTFFWPVCVRFSPSCAGGHASAGGQWTFTAGCLASRCCQCFAYCRQWDSIGRLQGLRQIQFNAFHWTSWWHVHRI